MQSNKFIFFISFLISVAAFGCGGNNEDTNEILIQDGTFIPEQKEVILGTEITWVNQTDTIQTVTSGIPEFILFDSGDIEPGESFTFTFNDIGPVEYYSKTNPDEFRGVISVVPEGVEQ